MNMQKLEDMTRVIRKDILTMIHAAGSGHPGGSLSAVELLAVLYFGDMINVDPSDPKWEGRDRFVLSKGHVGPVLYSILARKGFFSVEELESLRKLGSILQGHPHMACTLGLDCSSGSLGQGLSVANGMAIAFKRRGMDNRVYCMLGDGELQEGQIWEAVMTASQHKLDNLCAIVDYNHVQLDGTVEEIKNLGDLSAVWSAHGWKVIEIDGHNLDEIKTAYDTARTHVGQPTVVIANTVKGKGVSFMEHNCDWHGNAPDDEQLQAALKEIGGEME